MKYKTSELSGAMLDAAVAKALGMSCRIQHYSKEQWDGIQQPFDGDACIVSCMLFQPSTSWTQGGPIIGRERIGTTWPEESPPVGYEWHANLARPEASFNAYGPTPLIAAMRSYVSSKLGDEVEL